MKKIIVILMGMTLMFGAMSCSNISDTVTTSENTNSSNNGGSVTPNPSDDGKNPPIGEEDNDEKTNNLVCNIGETNILNLEYVLHYGDSHEKLNILANSSTSVSFDLDCMIRTPQSELRLIIATKHNNNKLDFSEPHYGHAELNNVYTISNVSFDNNTVNIFIEWTNN